MRKRTGLLLIVIATMLLGSTVGALADDTTYEIDSLPLWARCIGLPILVLTFFFVRMLVRMMVARSGEQNRSRGAATFPHLPDNLRSIRVPDIIYAIETKCGVVIKKEQKVPPKKSIYKIGVQNLTPADAAGAAVADVIWIRTPEKKEMPWTFYNGELDALEGHTISAIVFRSHENESTLLLVYNHATDQMLEQPSGVQLAHYTDLKPARVRGTAIGALGFAIGFWLLLGGEWLDLDNPNFIRFTIIILAALIAGVIPAAITAFMVSKKASAEIIARRNEIFRSEYLPLYSQFLRESTANVMARMSRPDNVKKPTRKLPSAPRIDFI